MTKNKRQKKVSLMQFMREVNPKCDPEFNALKKQLTKLIGAKDGMRTRKILS